MFPYVNFNYIYMYIYIYIHGILCIYTVYYSGDKIKKIEMGAACLDRRDAYRILVGTPEGKRPLGRSRRRWQDNIKMDFHEVG